MSGAALAYSGRAVMIVSVEDDPDIDGAVRVYVEARYLNRYFLTQGEDAQRAKDAWTASYCGHLVMDKDSVPPLIDGGVA
jgi:hypothetical protein